MEPLEAHVLFVGRDGRFAVGVIDETDGKYVQTQSDSGMAPGWTHVVAVGPHILFVGNDLDEQAYAVGHIDQETSHFVETDSGTGMAKGWSHVVAVGPHILFVRNDA